jgi:hypothetical protein
MAESGTRPAKGGETFDFRSMPDERFEQMNALIIKLEYLQAFKPSNVADGGADMVLAKDDRSGYARCWQSKDYPGRIRWDKCEKSLADAREHWDPEHYTFIFPRELSAAEEKTFNKKFGSVGIEVDYWNSVELESRLLASDKGERIARMFFDNPELERERTYQAIEAGGRLDNALDAMDRTANIGAFLTDCDPYFSYPASTQESGEPATTPPPQAVMSVTRGDDKVQTRIDVVPRDLEAMDLYAPQFVLAAGEGEAGERAAERLREALDKGNTVEIEDGLEMTFTRLPPGLESLVGEKVVGKVKLGPAKRAVLLPPPWKARLSASSAEGQAELDIELKPVATPPAGWDASLRGEYGGLSATLTLRRQGEGGQLGFGLHYSRNRQPVRDQLSALNFVLVTSAGGTLTITDIGDTGRPDFTLHPAVTPVPEDLRQL